MTALRILALRIGCDACGTKARIAPDCDLYATFAQAHLLPQIYLAELVLNGAFVVRAVRPA